MAQLAACDGLNCELRGGYELFDFFSDARTERIGMCNVFALALTYVHYTLCDYSITNTLASVCMELDMASVNVRVCPGYL